MSPLACEALDRMWGFDFNYRGNHHELVAEALGVTVRTVQRDRAAHQIPARKVAS